MTAWTSATSCSQRAAVAYLSGKDVFVSQYGSGSACKLYLFDFGLLPEGIYNVTTTRLDANASAPSSTSFSFIVQQPAPTSACSGKITITRTIGGTARLHFEDSYRGYAPTFGPPSVAAIEESVSGFPGVVPSSFTITILQQVADTANSQASGAAPSSAICHAEELDLGVLADGLYNIRWYDQLSVNGFDSGTRLAEFPFSWQNGGVQCTSVPQLLTPSLPMEGAPFDVAMRILGPGWQASTFAWRNGQSLILADVTFFIYGPYIWPPSCQTYKATVNPLPAGDYTLIWRFITTGATVSTSQFTVGKPTRRRAARH